ncbi:MAG: sensor histidine kinase [Acidimicrobiales bacterium]
MAVAVVLGVATVLAAAGVASLRTIESQLVGGLDAKLEQRANDIARFAPPAQGFPELPVASARPRTPFDVRQLVFVRIDDQGNVAAAIPAGPASDPDPLPDVDELRLDGEPQTIGSEGGSGPRYRAIAVTDPAGDTLVIGLSMADLDRSIEHITRILVVALVVALAGVSLIAWLVIRRGLRPIADMIVTAERIADGEHTERAPVANLNDEVGHLGRAINTMLDRIYESLAAKTASEERMRRFISDASHELRTPLTSIRGYAELYRTKGADPAEAATAVDRIEHEAKRMGVLVDDLLLLARLDQGRPLSKEAVDLGELVEDAVDAARVTHPERLIEVDLPDRPTPVLGDRNRLRQVLDNLLSNVREHTPPETRTAVKVSSTGTHLHVEITDNGPGIPAELSTHVFERFWQADPTGRSPSGTGLGLAIVAELVAAHNGSVDLTSQPGQGTTIEVRLPVNPDH